MIGRWYRNSRGSAARRFVLAAALLVVVLLAAAVWGTRQAALAQSDLHIYLPITFKTVASDQYVVLGWNDLGMHCYDRDYSVLSVLPPYNTIYAQVIQRGNPPRVITGGITVEYNFVGNTYSAGKTNFWDYAEKIFGVALAPNVGLTGKGMSGRMDAAGDHFIAEGTPLTEFSDNALGTPNYFQPAHLVVKNLAGAVLAETTFVAPISSEMRCDVCHNEPSPTNFRMNILQKHDEEEGTHLATQAAGGNPVLCAKCHSDPALGAPGNPRLPSLSAAMHEKHKDETNNCYACHPGPNTRCLRDVMSTREGMTCTDCHVGGMQMLANTSRTPWNDEPRCANCHDARHAENPGILYRFSKGHGGLYCESCHNSTHAILPSREEADNQQVMALQGTNGTLSKCTVCHQTQPTSGGPHH